MTKQVVEMIMHQVGAALRQRDQHMEMLVKEVRKALEVRDSTIENMAKIMVEQRDTIVDLKKRFEELESEYYLLGKEGE